MLSHTGEKPFICKQCNYLFVYLHIRHPGTSFLRSSYNYIFKNIAYVIVYVWPSRTWDEILLPFQKGLFFPLGDIRLFLPTRIRICAYAHHPTWIRHGRIRMAIPNLLHLFDPSSLWIFKCVQLKDSPDSNSFCSSSSELATSRSKSMTDPLSFDWKIPKNWIKY